MTLKKFGGSANSLCCREIMVGKELERAHSVDFNNSSYHTIAEACREDRLIYGVDASAKFLMTAPDDVFACVLPMDGYGDVTTQIYYKLLEAYCNENDIPFIQVDSSSKLSQLIQSNMPLVVPSNQRDVDEEDACVVSTPKDCTVILIRYQHSNDGSPSTGVCVREMARCLHIYQKYAHPIPLIILPTIGD